MTQTMVLAFLHKDGEICVNFCIREEAEGVYGDRMRTYRPSDAAYRNFIEFLAEDQRDAARAFLELARPSGDPDGEVMPETSPCAMCRHLKRDILPRTACSAFPEAIPFGILTGEVIHTKPRNGDNGIQFEEETRQTRQDAP